MRTLFYWLAKIGNLIVVAAWFLIGFVIFVPLSSLFLGKINYRCDPVTGKTDLTWRKLIETARMNGLLGRISGAFIKLGLCAIGDLIEQHDLIDEYLVIPF